MIIQCTSCSREFIVQDADIPITGRIVQCGYCSATWHQKPSGGPAETINKLTLTTQKSQEPDFTSSSDSIIASDGRAYKFTESQWFELLPSGKTGPVAKKKIQRELDNLPGRADNKAIKKRPKKFKEVDPSSERPDTSRRPPEVKRPKQRLGLLGYMFLLAILVFSIVGALITFETDLINHFPEVESIFKILDQVPVPDPAPKEFKLTPGSLTLHL